MLEYLKGKANYTHTENGAVTRATTFSECLDLFATIGAIRNRSDAEIITRFIAAYMENADIAMRILFYGRDVRGGLGERRVFRTVLKYLAENEPASVIKNVDKIAELGRYDDLLVLLGTPCEEAALTVIRTQLKRDMESDVEVSLLAKWLPSANASAEETKKMGKYVAKKLGMTEGQYRKTLSTLRRRIRIIENNLREKDYTFDYSKQPSKAMFKYRKAFLRNDTERYKEYLDAVDRGDVVMHTGTLVPYDVVSPCFNEYSGFVGRLNNNVTANEREAMDTTWRALEDFTGGENALVVSDGSGSMYSTYSGGVIPIKVALSLAIYFAERNKGVFNNHLITFSTRPRLIEIKGKDIYEKVRYCSLFNEVADTDLEAVFRLILDTAVENNLPQERLPSKLFIITDMEFNRCTANADLTNFENARKLFEEKGYKLPDVVFWNVDSRNAGQPVTYNEQGVALVSGVSPRVFASVSGKLTTPYEMMMQILDSERYKDIAA